MPNENRDREMTMKIKLADPLTAVWAAIEIARKNTRAPRIGRDGWQ